MATTSVSYTVTSGQVSTPEFSYAAIATLSSTTLNEIDQFVVTLNGDTLTPTTDYTVDEGTDVMTVSATIAEDDVLLITRVTDVDEPLVVFTNNALIDKDNLNDAIQQLLFRLQEIATDVGNSLVLNLSVDPACWNGQGYTTCNFLPATTSSGLITLAQYQNLSSGAETATLGETYQRSYTGDNTTTDFILDDAPTGLTDASQLFVFVNGVIQRTTTDFTLDITGTVKTLQFTPAPAASAQILVFLLTGQVAAVLASDTINGSALVDDSIGLAKLNFGAGSSGRILFIDSAGNPTAPVAVHTHISDFDTGVRQNRLDQMAAPTAAVSMNSQQITDVTAGTADGHAVNKGQMDTAISTALSTAPDVGAANVTGTTSTNLSTAVTGTNAGSAAMMVYATVTGTSGQSVDLEVKTSSGGYVRVGYIENNSSSNAAQLCGVVPAGGGYRISGDAGSDLLELTTQLFT